MSDPDSFVMQSYKVVNTKLNKAREEMDLFMNTLKDEEGPNKYQLLVDQALSVYQPPIKVEQGNKTPTRNKRQRTSTPLSILIEVPQNNTSVEMPKDDEPEQDEYER